MTGWPQTLWLARHGESAGNVARARAYAVGAEAMELDCCDAEVALTPRGQAQARGLGERLAALRPAERPTLALASTYHRAQDTLRLVRETAGFELPVRIDERFRDREQGILDLLTGAGIAARYPEEARRRALIGKFHYRPPGGESWADVALRLRSALTDLRLDAEGERVLVVSHDVVIILSRLVLTQLPVDQALRLSGHVANCSLTRYDAVPGGSPSRMRLAAWNDISFLEPELRAPAGGR